LSGGCEYLQLDIRHAVAHLDAADRQAVTLQRLRNYATQAD
jgi:hypothetical protein